VVHHFTCTDFGMWPLFTTLTTFIALPELMYMTVMANC